MKAMNASHVRKRVTHVQTAPHVLHVKQDIGVVLVQTHAAQIARRLRVLKMKDIVLKAVQMVTMDTRAPRGVLLCAKHVKMEIDVMSVLQGDTV